MRCALCVFAIAALTFAPDALATCETTSQLTGAAPLTVTFTTCEATAHWDFGDGASAEGQSVQHTFAAGRWTASAGAARFAITAEAVTFRVPKLVGYRHRLTFRGSIAPADPGQRVLIIAGSRLVASARTDAKGAFHVTRRITQPGPYLARYDQAQSEPLATTVKPRLDARVVGTGSVGRPLAVVAKLLPRNAGSVRIQVWRGTRLVADRNAGRVELNTRRAAAYRVRVTSIAQPGFTTTGRRLTAIVALPSLMLGAHGPSVRSLEQRLRDQHYALLHVDAYYGQDTYDAGVAFQKVHRLPRTGRVDAVLWRRLAKASVPRARYRGSHVEVDKTRQVLFEVHGGKVAVVVPVSTGATGNTPVGVWHVYSRVAGWSWVLWYPTYFLRGFAIHGYPSVPPYPASHGCVRVPMWVATRLFAMHPYGFPIYIYS